jgi:hypothetical protein
MTPPASAFILVEDGEITASVAPGPVEVMHAIPVVRLGGGGVASTMGVQIQKFPAPCHLVLSTEIPGVFMGISSLGTRRVSEMAALIDLSFPGLLFEKEWEGVPSSPGSYILAPESPITMTAQPDPDGATLISVIQSGRSILKGLPALDRDRFQLASRWYRRGTEATNPIDKILYHYIALEVFPACGEADIPRAVRNLLHDRIYRDLDPAVVKERCGIGPIAGLRAEIVHEGRIAVTGHEAKEVHTRLAQLEAIARTSLRALAGLPQSDELDKWLRSDLAA